MPSLTNKDCHDVARLWGWQWVRQDNQDMKAKAVMRWTWASCGESKDVRFDNMKKFGPGKHKCSKQSPPQGKEDNAKARDGRPSVTTLHCHQLAAEYGCDWLGVLVDNVVHVDDSLISSICVMRWQCWGCTTNFDRTYNKMKSRGFVCSTCNASQSKEDKKRAGQAGSEENKQRAEQVGSKENKQRAGQAGSKENKQRGGQAGSKENKQRAGQAGSKEKKQRAGQAGSKENKRREGQAGSNEDKQRAGQAGGVVASREDKQRAGHASPKEDKQRAGQMGGQAGSKQDKQRAGQSGAVRRALNYAVKLWQASQHKRFSTCGREAMR